MKRVLVTGGAGYIGSVVCAELLRKGYGVTCLDRCFFGTESILSLTSNELFHLVRNDIRSAGEDVLAGIDVVIDLAGLSNDPSCDLAPGVTREVNCEGCIRFAKTAKETGVSRYIYSSSCSVYGHGTGDLLTEESALQPVSLYARTKRAAEMALLELFDDDFSVVLLRNATVYGLSPRMRFDLMINIMTAFAVERGKIHVLGGGKQWRPNVHVHDVARAFVLALEADQDTVAGQIFNVGSTEQNLQVHNAAQLVAREIAGTTIELVPDDEDKRNYRVCFDKARDVLGFVPDHAIAGGIREIAQALYAGRIDFDDPKTRTVAYYKFLLDAERALEDVRLNGKVF